MIYNKNNLVIAAFFSLNAAAQAALNEYSSYRTKLWNEPETEDLYKKMAKISHQNYLG